MEGAAPALSASVGIATSAWTAWPHATGEGGTAIALTGSGLGLVVGSSSFVFGGFRSLDLVDTRDPTNTGAFVTRFNLPQVPNDLALANGMAFVADGTAGLQIVNYTGYDAKGVAPTVSIVADAVDVDPTTGGLQVLEGHTLRIVPTVTDDVQVRNVELLVNGQVVSNDLAFPFELFAAIPAIAAGGSTVTLQVRATDTGGNVALSNAITLQVVPDTIAPTVVSTKPASNGLMLSVYKRATEDGKSQKARNADLPGVNTQRGGFFFFSSVRAISALIFALSA